MRDDGRGDDEDGRGAYRLLPLGLELRLRRVRLATLQRCGEEFAEALARRALDDDEAPGPEAAVIRRRDGGGDQLVELRRRRAGLAELRRRDTGGEGVEGVYARDQKRAGRGTLRGGPALVNARRPSDYPGARRTCLAQKPQISVQIRA